VSHMNHEIRFVTGRDGVRIACASVGTGPPLVKAPNWLSHAGIDGDSPVWRHWWRELSRAHRFIRFDQRGCGLSDWLVKDLSFDRWVDDLEAVVDAVGLDRFVLLGVSQGGAVAVEYAARHPERVSHLVLVGAYAIGWAKRPGPHDQHEALLTLIRTGWGSENPAFRQIFTSQFMPQASAEQMNWLNDLGRASSSPDNAYRFQVEAGQIDVRARAANISAPALVFHSRQDARVPFDEGRQLASAIPGARFVALHSQNHILIEDEPAWRLFVSELRAFLATAPSRSADVSDPVLASKLTQRELEVLRLVAIGKTDRDIATGLSLSVRTVGNHVRNILDKTGSANRTAAAAWAAKVNLS
jgi:pimeloyl-ACP methyl ester carboxylesterase/DNA-binding CsgD family transcriptional regulator